MERSDPKSHATKWLQRIALGVIAVACAVGMTIGVVKSHHPAFQHEGMRFLQEIAHAKGVHVTFVPKKDSPNAPSGLKVDAYLIPTPRSDASSPLHFDGRLTYVHVNREYNFTMIDRRAFVTVEDLQTRTIIRNDCLRKDNVPPIADLVDAIANARVVDHVAGDGFELECNGNLVEFMFADEPYVFCSKPSTQLNKVHGEDLEATIRIVQEVAESFPSMESLTRPQNKPIQECDVLFEPTQRLGADAMAPRERVRRLMETTSRHTEDVLNVLTKRPRRALFGSADCGCRDGKKACLFVHGLGQTLDGPAQSTFPEYWGDIEQHAHCCSSIEFMRMDTIHNAWHNDTLPRKVCDTALSMLSNTANPMQMDNIALIGHSMGNLIISAAHMKGFCGINKQTSKWIALAGPITGSKSSTEALGLCQDNPNSRVDDLLISALRYFGVCPANTAVQALVHRDAPTTPAELRQLFDQATSTYRQQMTSNLCGVNPIGLVTWASVLHYALNLFSHHPTPENDGAVDFGSCHAGLDAASYETSWRTATLYKAAVNHADGAFRHGDGWWGNDRKPIRWFQCQF